MTLGTALKLFALTVVAYFVLDLLWIRLIAGPFYADALAPVMRSDLNWPAAAGFYAIHTVGILVFAVTPSLKSDSFPKAVGLGAVLGVVVYAAPNLTYVAIVQDFPWTVALVDMTWGTALSSTVAASAHDVARSLGVRPDPSLAIMREREL